MTDLTISSKPATPARLRLARSVAPWLLPLGLACLTLSACSSPEPEPTPAPPPAPEPEPTPSPSPALEPTPSFDNWMDAPQTAGDWRYSDNAQGGTARFGPAGGPARFAMTCDIATRQLRLERPREGVADARPMMVRTETMERMLPTEIRGDNLVASLSAGDRFLDAMAFSKGRFAVEVAGLPPLFVPAWPEVTRVIETCR